MSVSFSAWTNVISSPDPSGSPSGHFSGAHGSGTTNSWIVAGSGSGRRLRALRRLVVRPRVLLLDRAQLLLADEARLEEELAEARQRVGRARGLELLRRAVELVPVGVRVGVDAHAAGVDHGAAGAGADERDRLAHRAERVEDVEAVAVDDLQVQESREVVGRVEIGRLVALRHRDPVAVVLDDEDDRELLPRRAVDGLVEVALGRRRLAD